MSNIIKIAGPPGTGKTTTLLNIVEELLRSGINPRKICFISFTKKAATEAQTRAAERFNLTATSLPFFRTIHSLAFMFLGKERLEMLAVRDYAEIARHLGVTITFNRVSEDGQILGMSKGDRMLFQYGLYRAACKPMRDHFDANMGDDDISWAEFELLGRTITEYKRVHAKIDFNDLLEQFTTQASSPDISHLIVDEAQDLSPLQWQVVDKLAKGVNHVYIAGDDDQAIFRWAGADVDRFISQPGMLKVLPKSYRVPVNIQTVANKVIAQVSNRIEKQWQPKEEGGLVQMDVALSDINMGEGEWLLLARNVGLLEEYKAHCKHEGYIFDSSTGSPVRGELLDAIRAWEKLRKGEFVPFSQVKLVYGFMSAGRGVTRGFKQVITAQSDGDEVSLTDLKFRFGLTTDAIWHQALDRIPEDEREYFIAALRRGEKLLRKPRINIRTIHTVKGGEADHVVIMPDMAYRTFREYELNPEDEARVWYVAVTRARKSLYVLRPNTMNYYPLGHYAV